MPTRRLQFTSPEGDIAIALTVKDGTVITQLEPKVDTYALVVQECHEVLDELGIPVAKGTVCNDPKCQSALGHRLRMLRDLYLKKSLGDAKEH